MSEQEELKGNLTAPNTRLALSLSYTDALKLCKQKTENREKA